MEMSRIRRLLGRFNLLLTGLLAFGIWIAISVLASRPALKALWDVSPQAQFSVTAETEKLLAELRAQDKQLVVDTFFPVYPRPRTALDAHQIQILQRIQTLTIDLLRRYRDLGGDAVRVVHHDLLRDVAGSRARIEEIGGLRYDNSIVVSLGKRSKELSVTLDLADIHFPAAEQVQAPGASPTLPTLRMFKGEEAISSAIRSLLVQGSPRVYFITNYFAAELQGATADSYSELLSGLSGDGFEIALLDLEKQGRIPDDAAVVALMEPRREMSDRAAEAIFEYLKRGGRFVLNVSFSEVGSGWNPTFDNLGKLLDFELGKQLVCHLVPDPANPSGPGTGGAQAQNLRITDMPPRHPVTRPLVAGKRYPLFKLAREIRAREGGVDGVSCDPNLMRTGRWAWLAPQDPRTLQLDLRAPGDAAAYRVRSVGAVIDVAPRDGDSRPGHAVILGGMALLNIAFETNGDLGLNLFNWMAEQTELVTIRGNRYLSKRIELAPQQIARIENVLVFGAPGLLLALAVVVFRLRRRR